MNRIIIIGNGFDLAHGLKTGYMDFMNDYWTQVKSKVFNDYTQSQYNEFGLLCAPDEWKDSVVSVKSEPKGNNARSVPARLVQWQGEPQTVYAEFARKVDLWNDDSRSMYYCRVTFLNQFFERLSTQSTARNWVDIENAYYKELVALLSETDEEKRKKDVVTLNKEFTEVKTLLERYLSKVVEESTSIKPYDSIDDALCCPVHLEEIACGKQQMVFNSILAAIYSNNDNDIVEKEMEGKSVYDGPSDVVFPLWKQHGERWQYAQPTETLLLNFNYTNTVSKLYCCENPKYQIISIHGNLQNSRNPIVFGYGDELDDAYSTIEKLQDNEFLQNIKSMWYLETDNYRKLLEFIESEPYQVFVMGHSCGNSDRTLLNTLFEHPNCFSIKVYYHQEAADKDNYNDLVRNIYRNFNNKSAVRNIVVNRTYSLPLVPVAQ